MELYGNARKSSQQHPIFQGPIFIPSNSSAGDYYQFFAHLHMKFQTIEIYVGRTDDEKALTSSIRLAFGDKVIMVRCTNHLKKNIKDHMEYIRTTGKKKKCTLHSLSSLVRTKFPTTTKLCQK